MSAWKWTMHTDKLTTKCHICLHTWKQGGLMCGIWDWQSTIVKDLNDSQDPKHTLFCREIVFVAIYTLFSDKKCPLFTRLRGGSPKADIVWFFYRFSFMMASLSLSFLSSEVKYGTSLLKKSFPGDSQTFGSQSAQWCSNCLRSVNMDHLWQIQTA